MKTKLRSPFDKIVKELIQLRNKQWSWHQEIVSDAIEIVTLHALKAAKKARKTK